MPDPFTMIAQEEVDAAENEQMHAAEKDLPPDTDASALSFDYPLNDCLWQGPFLEVAERVKKRSWPVWLGTYAAIMARVERRISCDWHRSLLCGMPFTLMVGYSGSDKGLASRICKELMPQNYRVRGGVSSGPGLIEILRSNTQEEQDESMTPDLIPSQPALLVVEEWTGLLKYAGLNASTLYEDICRIYHTRSDFSHTAKKRKGEGGDQNLEKPTLSILGTTTPQGFTERVNKEALTRGFINRHLILPCKADTPRIGMRPIVELQSSNGYHPLFPELLTRFLEVPHEWQSGEAVEFFFEPDAYEVMNDWIMQNVSEPCNRYQNQEPPLIHMATIPRLDRHCIQVALAYALVNKRQLVSVDDVEAAVWVADTARQFTERLVAERPIKVSHQTEQNLALDELIQTKIRERVGSTKKEIQHRLKRHADYPEIGNRIERLIQQGIIQEIRLNGTKKKGLRINIANYREE